MDPAAPIRRQTAAGHDAVQMRMMLQVLTPGMQDGEESDFGAQVFGIGANRSQRVGGRATKQVIDRRLVLAGDSGDLLGQREDDVEVTAIEQIGLPMLDPFGPGERLALRAVPIPAGVV
jgi:hypothetical protein